MNTTTIIAVVLVLFIVGAAVWLYKKEQKK